MLTKQEQKISTLHAAGLSAEEIADKIGVGPNTARKHIDNIKKKVGWSKATELAGFGICEFLGINYSEIRQKILSSLLLTIFILSISNYDNQLFRRTRLRSIKRQEIEYAI